MANKLIGSAGTKEQLLVGIEKYYAGTKFNILDSGHLQRISDNKILSGVIVISKKGRYRFEVLA